MSKDRRVVVELMPGETISLEIKFVPREIGEFKSQVRLFVADNPNEDRTFDLKGAAYTELFVLEGLELVDVSVDNSVDERRESDRTLRRPSSGLNSTVRGKPACEKDTQELSRRIPYQVYTVSFI